MARRFALPPRLIMLGSFGGMSIVNYGFGLATGWLLLPGDFGLLAFVQTLLTVAGLLLNSGFAGSLTAALVGAERARRAGLVRGALVGNLLLALAIGAVILVLFGLGPLQPGLESWAIAGLVCATLPLLSAVTIARATANGAERFGLVALLLVVEAAVKALAGVGLVLAGFGVLGAIAGFLIGALVATVLGLALLLTTLEIRLWGRVPRPALRAARDIFGALLGMALLLNLDVVALKLFADGERALVGYYQAGIVLANMPYYLTTAMLPVLFTQIARLKDLPCSAAAVGEALRLTLVLILPVELCLIVAAEPILGLLFPDAYRAGAAALRMLALANSALIVVAILSAAFQAAGSARTPARILLTVVLIEAVVLRVVVPQASAVGAASVFCAAAFSALIALGIAYSAAIGRRRLQPIPAWLARYAVALALGGIVTAGTLSLTGAILPALAVGGVCYLGAALVLGLVPQPRVTLSAPRLGHEAVAKGK